MAAVTGAVLGAGAAIYGASKSSKAAKQSANAQVQAADTATAEQRRQFDLSRNDQMPWLQTGTWALDQQKKALQGDWSGFNNSPDYQFALDQGFKGLDRSAASKGRLYSGGYGEDLTKFGQGLATQNYGNYMNRLAGLSNTGQTSANSLGLLGANYANNAAQNTIGAGDARASGYTNSANSWGNAASQIGGIAGNYFGNKSSTYGAPSGGYGSVMPAMSWDNGTYSGIGSPSWNSLYGGN
jgi:hypothetical protein